MTQGDVELKVLRLPIYTGVVVSLLALIAAPLTGSQTILLDGFFNLVYLITGIFTYRVGTLLWRGASRRFPFGYAPLEPLVNLIKSLLIAGVSMLSVWYATSSLFEGGTDIKFGGALLYAFVSAAITIGMAAYVWLRYRHMKSPLVQGDLAARAIDALTAFGALLAFVIAYLLQAYGHTQAARYVDPILTLALVAMTVGIPWSLGKGALAELLYMAPPPSETDPIESKVRQALQALPLAALDIRTVRIGRSWEVMIHAQLQSDAHMDTHAADTCRKCLEAELLSQHSQLRPVLVFSYDAPEPLH
ncbi:cation diffusion facilitator family transporter [Acinetobacter soli]|uniref:cation diffusion facilitator family transporter n=1 Tax=Acinetobacter soli TaxID=487316 RepID=UPI0031BB8EBC